MGYEAFTLEVAEGVGHVRLTQSGRGNPFDAAFLDEVSLLATECDEDDAIRCVLIEAEGRFFSVGADLQMLTKDREQLRRVIKNGTAGLHMAISRFARMDAPVVTAVHALAVGGGVALAAASDYCLAGSSARFYCGYTGIGLTPDGGATAMVTRRVGTRRSADFFLRNRNWSAQEACEYGLVSEVVDDAELSAHARALAVELAAGPTRAYGELKNLLLSAPDQTLEAQLEDEARAMGRIVRTDDAWNAMTAVAGKRTPTFEGR
jgi:2-(1,2-epoxy-1,2-dihydrophenyl)acetyl-CoA isomerase